MRVIAENLPIGTSSELVKREFQRAGSCKVEVHVSSIQETTAFIDYLDIVNANNAIKLFDGKTFGDSIITVKKHFDSMINLSIKRPPSTSVINLSSTSTTLNLSSKKSEKNREIFINLKKTPDSNKPNEDQVIKFRKIEEVKIPVHSSSNLSSSGTSAKVTEKLSENHGKESLALPASKTVGVESKTIVLENKVTQASEVKSQEKPQEKIVEKIVDKKKEIIVEKTKEIIAEKNNLTQTSQSLKNSKVSDEFKENDTGKGKSVKEMASKGDKEVDNLIVEKEGSKFRRISDDKYFCILCKKELSERSIKTHVNTKAHIALM
jgi:hypothetical protein